MKKIIILLAFIGSQFAQAQNVGINTSTPDNSAALDITATDKGMLVPRMTQAQRTAIASPATGLLLYQTDAAAGFYYFNGAVWTLLEGFKNKIQDADANTKIETEQTPNENKIRFALDGTEYFSMNKGSLEVLNTGGSVFMGKEAGLNEMYAGGNHNVGIGFQALKTTQSSFDNVAVGSRALWSQSDGNRNVAVGTDALRSNNNNMNTAIGAFAGAENIGSGNIFVGNAAGENELGDNKLYIANTNTATPLLFGDFAAKKLTVNDSLQTKFLRLPTGAANGYILKSDTRGNATWVAPTTFSESDPKVGVLTTNKMPKWNGTTLTDGQVFDNGTNVGIGTNTPSEKLEVDGKTKTTNFQMTNGAANGYTLTSDANGNATWTAPAVFSESDPKVGVLTTNKMPKWNGTTLTDGQVFDNGMNVGVGTATPNFKLHVNGTLWGNALYTNSLQADDINVTDVNTDNLNVATNAYIENLDVTTKTRTTNLQVTNGATNGYVLKSDASGNATWVNPTTLPIAYTETDPKIAITTANTVPKWNGTSLANGTITDNGNIGIGVSAPTQKLEVAGNTKTTNLQMTTGATNGYVLQSNASGNATWVNPTTLSVTETDPQVSSVTTNKIPRWNGTSLVDGAIYDGGTNVGIGVAAPVARLEVNGEARATALRAATTIVVDANSANTGTLSNGLTFGNASGEGIASDRSGATSSSYGLDFYTAHLQRMTIDNDGNVGIGEPNPNYKLDVSGTASVADLKITNGAADGYILKSDATGNATWTAANTIETDPKVGNLTTNYLAKWNGTTLANGLITDNGTNIGIGTTTTSARFAINSTIATTAELVSSATAGTWLNLNNTSTGGSIWNFVATGATNSEGAGHLLLRNNGSIRMTLNNAGNVGIGTSTPAHRLHIESGTNNIVAGLSNTATAGAWLKLANASTGGTDWNFISTGSGNGEGAGHLLFRDNSTVRMTLKAGGNVGIGTTTPAQKLDVAGTTKTTGFQMPTGATDGYILSSDASGNATWSDPNGLITIAESDPKVGSLTNNYLPKWNGSSLANSQVYDNGTFVSIGTTTINNGKFVVAASMPGTGSYGYLNSDGSTGFTTNNLNSAPYSIYAAYRIAAASFNAFSDKRIKNIIGISNNENDLALLLKIKITDYKMIDTIAKGNQVHKKVIAQEVADILPSAVSKTTEFIPNIYKIAQAFYSPSQAGETSGANTFISLENHGLIVGNKVKLFFDTKEEVVEVLGINEKGFYTSLSNPLVFGKAKNGLEASVFVFGKLVNDFHTVDYEALSTLNISATQALLKRLNAAEEKVKTQETRLEEQANRLSKLEAIIFKTTAEH